MSTAGVNTTESLVERLMAEGLIGLPAAAKLYGSSRNGRPTHPSTPCRHCLHGVVLPTGERLKLEHIRVAGKLMTSRQAVLRFFEAQQNGATTSPPRSPAKRQGESERAEAELKKAGL